MRTIVFLGFSLAMAMGLSWTWMNYPEVRSIVSDVFVKGNFQTLEVQYSAETIMTQHKKELLKDNEHSFLEPDLKFHPYLLMEVKYSRSFDKTSEGIILWSLVDGEMVVNTHSWIKTHGFMDCIRSNANSHDFKIIKALSAHGGMLEKESLGKVLNIENDTLDIWLDGCRKKSLIVKKGHSYRLHLQNPRLAMHPETKLGQWLVTKSAKNAEQIPKRFRAYQIENIAKAAFGNDFAIRKTTEIFLPVYGIIVQNPDGSIMTTYWNALNGKKFSPTYHIE